MHTLVVVVVVLLGACSTSPASPATDARITLDGSGSATDGSAGDGSATDSSTPDAMESVIAIVTTQEGFDTYNFGAYGVGMASFDLSLTVTNTGSLPTAPLVFTYKGFTPMDFPIDANQPDSCSGQVLAGGATCVMSVRFIPQGTAARSAGMHPNGQPTTMGLIGTGI